MGFRIHAAGSGRYRWHRDYADEGDVYDLAQVMSVVMATPGGVRGVAQEVGTNQVLSQSDATSDSAVQRATRAVGQLTCMHTLRDAFLLCLAERHRVQISVFARTSSSIPFWPDTSAYSRFDYSSGDHRPFWDFINDITPKLEETGLNGFTVLCAIAAAISSWPTRRTRGMPMLNIHLST